MFEPPKSLNPVSFPVRRYDPEDAEDAWIEFSPITVEAFLAHEILRDAEMTGQTRRRIREEADTVHEIRVDKGPVVGLHVVFRRGLNGGPLHLTPYGKREPVAVRAASIFRNREYRIDENSLRERAVTRVLDVYGIPPVDCIEDDWQVLVEKPRTKRPRKFKPAPPASE